MDKDAMTKGNGTYTFLFPLLPFPFSELVAMTEPGGGLLG